MKRLSALLLVLSLLLVPSFCFAQDEPPPDPFDTLVAATTQLADLAQTLKPAASNVTAKEEAVQRKKAELADAETAQQTAKAAFNQALADFIAAIDALKAAAMQIPPANGGGGNPPAPVPGG